MIILAIDAALPRAGLALTNNNQTIAKYFCPGRPGLIETLPTLIQTCLTETNTKPNAIAVTIGPGSFTGLRTTLSLAQGYASAAAIPCWGVTLEETFAQAFPQNHRPLWVAIRARQNRIFLLRDNQAEAFADNELPRTKTPIAAAGNAANELAAHIAATGGNIILTNARTIDPTWVARAALARIAAGLQPHQPQPLYIDPPETKQPTTGPRPPPQ